MYRVYVGVCVCVVAATDWFHGHFKLSCGSSPMDVLIGESAIRGKWKWKMWKGGRGEARADNGTDREAHSVCTTHNMHNY